MSLTIWTALAVNMVVLSLGNGSYNRIVVMQQRCNQASTNMTSHSSSVTTDSYRCNLAAQTGRGDAGSRILPCSAADELVHVAGT